ncbi:FRG domain-containing protein [Salinicola halophyticus]
MDNKIFSIGGLVEIIRAEKKCGEGSLWFRGQADKDWNLLPSLLRQKYGMSESTLLTRFKQSAAMLTASKPLNSFDWIFLMQHYGVPTRLLDWTENPLVALYFAVENKNTEEDAALWILRPNKLNTHAHIDDKDESDYIPSFDDDEVEGYSTERVRIDKRMKLLPIATIATRNNPRIQAQLGTFTIHHNASVPIEEVGDKEHCRKIIIPGDSKAQIRSDLSNLGVNRLALFPEMESISETLREIM